MKWPRKRVKCRGLGIVYSSRLKIIFFFLCLFSLFDPFLLFFMSFFLAIINMGKFRNQKKNLVRNKVAIAVGKVKQMKAAAKSAKKDGEDVRMTEELPKVRGLAVSSLVC